MPHKSSITYEFLGLKYAHVESRFEPAQSLEDEESFLRKDSFDDANTKEEVLDATKFGPSCWQSGIRAGKEHLFSEECLFLNIYVPSSAIMSIRKQKRKKNNNKDPPPPPSKAVMVFIHGGSFTHGSGSQYDGKYLSGNHDVIVITLNYRLGPLGFMVLDSNGRGGMTGIEDQVMALRWIRKNIGHFGGDAEKVTVFGESAGGLSICALAVSPLVKKDATANNKGSLFRRAIIDSGPCTTPVLGWSPYPSVVGWNMAMENVKMFGAESVEDLKNKTRFGGEDLSSWPLLDEHPSWTVDPRVVGSSSIRRRYLKGLLDVEAMIIGSNSFDGVAPWVYGTHLFPDTFNIQNFRMATMSPFYGGSPSRASDIFASYDPTKKFNGNAAAALIQMNGDSTVLCPQHDLASVVASHRPGGVFVYVYSHLYKLDISLLRGIIRLDGKNATEDWKSTWASHASELFLVFGPSEHDGPDPNIVPFTQFEYDLSRSIQSSWAEFAIRDDPVSEWKGLHFDHDNNKEWWSPVETDIVAGEGPTGELPIHNVLQFRTPKSEMLSSYHGGECESFGRVWEEAPMSWILRWGMSVMREVLMNGYS